MSQVVSIPTSFPFDNPSIDAIVDYCLRLRPDEAAEQKNSSLCVTPLIDRVDMDGSLRQLRLDADKWGAGYARVSTLSQRSGVVQQEKASTVKRDTSKSKRQQKQKQEGYSEEEQLRRCIRYFADQGIAFKIYSDAGITGAHPPDIGELVSKIIKKKAARYKKTFKRILLDTASMNRRTPDEISAMNQYLDEKVARILRDAIPEEDLYTPSATYAEAKSKRIRRGRPRTQVFYRQGLTQLWHDISQRYVCVVSATDRSRLCRDADMESALFEHCAIHEVSLVGLIEELPEIDIEDPMKKGVAYFIASANEYDLIKVKTNSMRGVVQHLESGYPHGQIPWWSERDEDGRAQLVPEYGEAAKNILDLYLTLNDCGCIPRGLPRLLPNGACQVN